MIDATTKILEHLQRRHYRITKARRLVIERLLKATQPKSVADIAKEVTVDMVSVYRTVELLRQEGWLEEFADGTTTPRYAIQLQHHHHIICEQCQRVSHVACEQPVILTDIPKGFQTVRHHAVTFYGLCIDCADVV